MKTERGARRGVGGSAASVWLAYIRSQRAVSSQAETAIKPAPESLRNSPKLPLHYGAISLINSRCKAR